MNALNRKCTSRGKRKAEEPGEEKEKGKEEAMVAGQDAVPDPLHKPWCLLEGLGSIFYQCLVLKFELHTFQAHPT